MPVSIAEESEIEAVEEDICNALALEVWALTVGGACEFSVCAGRLEGSFQGTHLLL